MSLDVHFTRNLEDYTLSGIVLAVRGAQAQGGNTYYLAGALAQGEHMILVSGGNWDHVLQRARTTLGADHRKLLETALRLPARAG